MYQGIKERDTLNDSIVALRDHHTTRIEDDRLYFSSTIALKGGKNICYWELMPSSAGFRRIPAESGGMCTIVQVFSFAPGQRLPQGFGANPTFATPRSERRDGETALAAYHMLLVVHLTYGLLEFGAYHTPEPRHCIPVWVIPYPHVLTPRGAHTRAHPDSRAHSLINGARSSATSRVSSEVRSACTRGAPNSGRRVHRLETVDPRNATSLRALWSFHTLIRIIARSLDLIRVLLGRKVYICHISAVGRCASPYGTHGCYPTGQRTPRRTLAAAHCDRYSTLRPFACKVISTDVYNAHCRSLFGVHP